MLDHLLEAAMVSRRLVYLALLLCACGTRMSLSQTPSPLQEWQYPGGVMLEQLFEPNLASRFVVGASGDLQAFMPLAGSSKILFMLAGPSITFSDRQYTQKVFAVSGTQAATSGYRGYAVHGGLTAAGMGFGTTYFIMRGWLISADVAANRVLASASDCPITQATFQRIVELTPAYQW